MANTTLLEISCHGSIIEVLQPNDLKSISKSVYRVQTISDKMEEGLAILATYINLAL